MYWAVDFTNLSNCSTALVIFKYPTIYKFTIIFFWTQPQCTVIALVRVSAVSLVRGCSLQTHLEEMMQPDQALVQPHPAKVMETWWAGLTEAGRVTAGPRRGIQELLGQLDIGTHWRERTGGVSESLFCSSFASTMTLSTRDILLEIFSVRPTCSWQ